MAGVEASLVDQAVFDLLVSVVPWPVGWSSAPTAEEAGQQNVDPLVEGYAVMNRIPAPSGAISKGVRDQVDSMRVLRYQIFGIGSQVDQAQLIAEQTGSVLTAKDPAGQYVHTLAVAGHAVMRRWFVTEAPPDPGGPLIVTVQAGQWIDVMVSAST